jgi:hypothetical protein
MIITIESLQNCISLIERHAPRLMKEGGGAIEGDKNQFVVKSNHVARMIELYSRGIKSTEISRIIGCSKPTVTKYLRMNGMGTRILGPKKTKEASK